MFIAKMCFKSRKRSFSCKKVYFWFKKCVILSSNGAKYCVKWQKWSRWILFWGNSSKRSLNQILFDLFIFIFCLSAPRMTHSLAKNDDGLIYSTVVSLKLPSTSATYRHRIENRTIVHISKWPILNEEFRMLPKRT